MDGIDPRRIALWGTSYSGGHVLAVAARDRRVAAVIAQGAAVDGLAIMRKAERADPSAPRSKGPRMLAAALSDAGRALLRRAPRTVAAVGAPGAFALLTDASSYADYLAMMGPTWRNAVCAGSLLTIPFNRPIIHAASVRCPTLLIIAEQDTIAPGLGRTGGHAPQRLARRDTVLRLPALRHLPWCGVRRIRGSSGRVPHRVLASPPTGKELHVLRS